MNWLKQNWLKIFVSLSVLVVAGSVFYYYALFLQEQSKVKNSQTNQINELQTQLTNIQAELEQEKNKPPQVIQKTIPVATPAQQSFSNNDLTLLNYKIDAQSLTGAMDLMLNTAYNSPEQMCPAIVGSRTTQNNIYYKFKKSVVELETKYGQYRNTISYINTNLNGMYGAISTVQDKCAALGYNIN